MDSNIMETIEEFMGSALVLWVQLFERMVEGEDNVHFYSEYMEVNSVSQHRYLMLTNGVFLNEVMRVIDPNPKMEQLYHNERDDHMLRVQNFSILNRHLRAYYQEYLQQLILMPLPNIAILGQDPLTEAAIEELKRLLLLLLGCAVQCERKETFIQQIQSLDIETQADIARCIQEVTQDPRMVLPLQWEELGGLEEGDLQLVFGSMAKQIQGLLAQRDTHLERIVELCREREAQTESTTVPLGGHSKELPQSLALQLADSRAKLRRLKQQLEDKGDQLLDSTQEIQAMEQQLKKLQKENRSLQAEARGMRALRDELDCVRERASRAEHVQTELQSCKHRLRSLELTRTQLKEQQQLCAALQETKALLEQQLTDARARCSSLRELERDNLLLRQRIIDVEAERDTERQRVDELLEMNMSLEADLRQSRRSSAPITMVHHHFHQSEIESDEELGEMIDLKPWSVEVGEASTLRLLGAEQENAELKRRLAELQAQREAHSPDMMEERAYLEKQHQNTLGEYQNMKNENITLKQQVELLTNKLQLIAVERRKEGKKGGEGEEEYGERGVQGSESSRGEGEGTVRSTVERERRGEITRTLREAGVGEEILHLKEDCGASRVSRVSEPKNRGEAEGGQKDKEREKINEREGELTKEEATESEPQTAVLEIQLPPTKQESKEDDTAETDVDQRGCSPPGPHMELVITQLQQALEEADRQALVAQELRSKLAEQSKKAWEAEQRLVVVEAELHRLKKTAENLGEARRQIEVLQSDSLEMEEELCRLRSQAELHRMQATVIATLEGERAALERDRDTLRSSVDTLRTAQRKVDQLELTNHGLKAELERQGRSLDTCRRREEELDVELREVTLEVQSLARGRDQALLEASRLEQEKETCQSDLEGQRKEGRQREREAARLRQQLESTTMALEHSNQRARGLDTEHRRACQELSQSKELCARLQDLEKELRIQLQCLEEDKQQLKTLNTDAQAKISSLSQDLSSGKELSQELSNEVVHLKQEVEKREAELTRANDSLNSSQARIKSILQSLKESESENKRRSSIGVQCGPVLEWSTQTHSPQTQSRGTPVLAPPLDDGKGCDLSMTPNDSTVEADRFLRERLIELERENAVLIAEREALKSRLSRSQEACDHLREQLEALQRHSLSLQDSCTRLQTLNTQLQVEQATLNSQHASVLARCSESEARCATLEAESKVWARERDESSARMEAVRRDHERMTTLQQRQEAELDELLEKHSQLRGNSRTVEGQHRELEARYEELLNGKAQVEEKEREMKMEREKLEAEAQGRMERQRELERAREENERLQAQQTEWMTAQAELLAQGSVLRGELSAAQLERTRIEGELSALRENNQSLDLSNVRLTSQYQLLTQLKSNMEEESRHLGEQNQSLLKENRALLEQSMERREEHHTEQREYQEKLSELRREKQKLVEKIMDQFRVLEYSMQPAASKAKKSNWIADRMKKLIKPRGGGGAREGRALFTAAGSVENLADGNEYTVDTHTPLPDSRSTPASPSSPMRRLQLQGDTVISGPGILATRPGSGGRRKLGSSRHGWRLGTARDGVSGVSQSFSPGDHKTQPRLRLRSSQHDIPWEGEKADETTPKEAEAAVSSQESIAEDGERDNQHSSSSNLTD